MSLKTKLAKAAKAQVKKAAPAPKKAKTKAERREAPRAQEVLSLFTAGEVTPGAEWVIAGQGVAHPLGALDEVLKDVPRTREGNTLYARYTGKRRGHKRRHK